MFSLWYDEQTSVFKHAGSIWTWCQIRFQIKPECVHAFGANLNVLSTGRQNISELWQADETCLSVCPNTYVSYGKQHYSWLKSAITKTYLYNFDPLKPHFYIVNLGFKRVYIIFLISAQNIYCGYSLEPPRRGGSNEYQQSMFWAEVWKILEFLSENLIQFLVVKFSIYLNRRVFVMLCRPQTV